MSTIRRCLARPCLVGQSIVGLTVLFVAYAESANGQQLPEGRGRALVERACSQCHTLAFVTQFRLTSDGWRDVVRDMIGRGATLSDQ
jgi:hypothetical protein